ncbi:uncharacterized protein ColSpa_03059 [Colletotrichum spaethianum]|uniref:Uncharacterized protein n=1 Tax=Colletotrichum spaethianum TaxID=700344 RepID=A0AA37NZZ8_9PEZI|nr:uncharacterized protein ColSpa_03059 [Colletotrichum spaethianum]GKT42878.1 hypothetical protein ColSpa_03059 [Colletotrichum spaethianum]
MATGSTGCLPGLDDINYFGIGTGAELAASSYQSARSQSPGDSSINLELRGEIREFLYRRPSIQDPRLLRFRHSGAPSPESLLAGDETAVGNAVQQEEDAQQVTQPSDDYPATPEASSSSSLRTITTFAGPLKSYLACPQTHEKRALSLFRDDDDGEQGPGSSDRDSVVVSKRRVPSLYRPPNRDCSPLNAAVSAKSSRFGHMMERYLASEDIHEDLGDQSGEMASKDGYEDSPEVPSHNSEAAQPSGDAPSAPGPSIPLSISQTADVIAPIAGILDGPIEVGDDRHSADSAISDMEADELHHLL